VAFSQEYLVNAGRPFVATIEPFFSGISPMVEANIPLKDGRKSITRDRKVNGCFARDATGRVWLCHRGAKMTVHPGGVPKKVIHHHFQKWLVTAHDGRKKNTIIENDIIPIAHLEPGELCYSLYRFAESVRELKDWWTRGNRDEKQVPISGNDNWLGTINFPESIGKILRETDISYEYRHGPIQSGLQHYLNTCLADGHRAVLNNRIDLGIAKGKELLAIFEVKTALGSQLYSGIGQLLIYRQLFTGKEAPLFLALPGSVFASREERRETKHMLEQIGVTLVLQEGMRFRLADGRELAEALDPQWLRRRVA
jgi:hypothetical protein